MNFDYLNSCSIKFEPEAPQKIGDALQAELQRRSIRFDSTCKKNIKTAAVKNKFTFFAL